MNIVHEDENWRQRLRAEQAAAGQWRDSWGFLEHAKPAGSVHVDRQIPNRHLTRTIAEQGILYPFLVQTYRDNRDGTATSRFTVGGTAHSTQPSTASTAKVWRGDPDAPRWNPQAPFATFKSTSRTNAAGQTIMNGSQTARGSTSQRYPASPPPDRKPHPPQQTHYIPHPPAAAAAATQSSTNGIAGTSNLQGTAIPPLDLAPLQARPPTPVLHLDLPLAKTLMPKYEQDIGGCVWTNGCDPHVKYRHPLLSSHRIGWSIQNRSLEFFTRGAGPNATRDLSTKRLYGWD